MPNAYSHLAAAADVRQWRRRRHELVSNQRCFFKLGRRNKWEPDQPWSSLTHWEAEGAAEAPYLTDIIHLDEEGTQPNNNNPTLLLLQMWISSMQHGTMSVYVCEIILWAPGSTDQDDPKQQWSMEFNFLFFFCR